MVKTTSNMNENSGPRQNNG